MNKKGSLEWNLETVGKLIFYALILLAIIYMSMQLIKIFVNSEHDFRAKQNVRMLSERIDYSLKEGVRSSVVIHAPENYLIAGFNKGQGNLTMELNKGALSRTGTALVDLLTLAFPPLIPYRLGQEGRYGITLELERPSGCRNGKTCVCVMRIKEDPNLISTQSKITFDSVLCKSVKADVIGGTSGKLYHKQADEWMSWDTHEVFDLRQSQAPDGRPFYPLLMTSVMGPRSVIINTYPEYGDDGLVILDPICTDSEKADFPDCK